MMNDRRTLAACGSPQPLALVRTAVRDRPARLRDECRRAGAGGAGRRGATDSAEELGKLVGPIALYPDDLVAIILPASTNPLQLVQADRFLDKRKADPKLPVDDKWDDRGQVAAQLSRRREDDERRPRLDERARRSGRRRPGRRDRGRRRPFAARRRPRATSSPTTSRSSRSRRRSSYIEPADPQVIYVPQYNPTTVVVAGPAPVLRLLPDAVPVVLLPVCARCRARRRRHLGRGDRRGLERQPLRLLRGRQHQRQPQHEHQQGQRQSRWRRQRRGGGTAWKSNKQPGQVSSSVGKTARRTCR